MGCFSELKTAVDQNDKILTDDTTRQAGLNLQCLHMLTVMPDQLTRELACIGENNFEA